MINKKNIFIFIILCFVILTGLPNNAVSRLEIYPQTIDAKFEYDNNVTREKHPEDYERGIIWRLSTGLGIRNFIPVKNLDTDANYTLIMRDVNTTNNEDFNAHSAELSSEFRFRNDTKLSLNEAFKVWNSQSDMFNFYSNSVEIGMDHLLQKNTRVGLLYRNEGKWFQNDIPEVQAKNYIYHRIAADVRHSISRTFTVQLGDIYQLSMYNRSPIDFVGGRQIVKDGVQRDQQNIIQLGFYARDLFNKTTSLTLINQYVNSDSNSRAFNYNGNRAQILLLSRPYPKFSVKLNYQIVAYNLEAYQTPGMGYELSESRTDDQSFIRLGMTYDISDQVSLQFDYEHVKNTVFFTREFYEKNTASAGLKVRF